MLIILTSHPIQYQAPLWRALAQDGRVPFEVWFMCDHAVKESHDVEFGNRFAWDIDVLEGYPHRFLKNPGNVHPASFWKCRIHEPLQTLLKERGASALWIQGWQVFGYWQAAAAARRAGVDLWLRGESNDLAPPPRSLPKRFMKQLMLKWLFRRVKTFFYIGQANCRFYKKYGVQDAQLLSAPYAVDNERFQQQAQSLAPQRSEIRRKWGIPEESFCVLFCGKFVPKKRPTHHPGFTSCSLAQANWELSCGTSAVWFMTASKSQS
jgi:hypothetical protein